MAKVLVTEDYLSDIGDAIRGKLGGSTHYTPGQMASAISSIPTVDPTLISKSISANGTYNADDDNADGYDSVSVNVPNSYSAQDEGKVVSSGALVAQESQNVSQNGTYDTTLKNQVVVAVPNSYSASDEGKVVSSGELISQNSMNISENGVYDTTEKNEVSVNVSGGGSGIPGVTSGTTAPDNSVGNDGDLYIRFYSLPSNVNFRSYLEGDGNAYINTGIIADEATGLYVSFKTNGQNSPASGRQSATNRTFGVTFPAVETVSLDFNTERRQSSVTDGDDVEVYLSRRISEVNGVNIFGLSPGSSFTTPVPVILFGINAANSYGLVSAIIRIYRATFTENGQVVADFIPALDSNDTPCMYEAISGNYYYNARNTGSFAYGESVTPNRSKIIYKKIKGSWCVMNQAGEVNYQ